MLACKGQKQKNNALAEALGRRAARRRARARESLKRPWVKQVLSPVPPFGVLRVVKFFKQKRMQGPSQGTRKQTDARAFGLPPRSLQQCGRGGTFGTPEGLCRWLPESLAIRVTSRLVVAEVGAGLQF